MPYTLIDLDTGRVLEIHAEPWEALCSYVSGLSYPYYLVFDLLSILYPYEEPGDVNQQRQKGCLVADELTPWFDALTQPPVRSGFYEIEILPEYVRGIRYFDHITNTWEEPQITNRKVEVDELRWRGCVESVGRRRRSLTSH